MTSQGSAHGRFQRHVRARNVFHAELAARELGRLSLENALALVVMYAEANDDKFERAAVKWLGMLLLKRPMHADRARGLVGSASHASIPTLPLDR